MNNDRDLRKNAEGYPDPTAYEALNNVDKERAKEEKRLLNAPKIRTQQLIRAERRKKTVT